jgi:hypothetical protein
VIRSVAGARHGLATDRIGASGFRRPDLNLGVENVSEPLQQEHHAADDIPATSRIVITRGSHRRGREHYQK